MTGPSRNAELVTAIFDEVAKGNGAPFWEACHDDIVWRTIGVGSWSGEFTGKQAVIDESPTVESCPGRAGHHPHAGDRRR